MFERWWFCLTIQVEQSYARLLTTYCRKIMNMMMDSLKFKKNPPINSILYVRANQTVADKASVILITGADFYLLDSRKFDRSHIDKYQSVCQNLSRISLFHVWYFDVTAFINAMIYIIIIVAVVAVFVIIISSCCCTSKN